MNAIFGNSEQIRLKHYRQPDTDAEYAALGGLGEKRKKRTESGSQRSKKSPYDSPYSGGFDAYFAFLNDLRKRRLSYLEMCHLMMEEQGFDKKSFDKFAKANPTIYEMSTFINSLLFEGYDETQRRGSWRSAVWDWMRIGIKLPRLLKKFRKNLKVPKEYTEGRGNSTESPSSGAITIPKNHVKSSTNTT